MLAGIHYRSKRMTFGIRFTQGFNKLLSGKAVINNDKVNFSTLIRNRNYQINLAYAIFAQE